MRIPKSIRDTPDTGMPLFRLRASQISKIVTGTVVGISAGFSVLFVTIIYRIFVLMNAPTTTTSPFPGLGGGFLLGNFFSNADVLMYVTIECLFLAAVLFGTWMSVRRKNYK
jgi:hypothetical protein